MSQSIHVQGFKNKDFCKFKRSIVWDIFGTRASWTREGWGLMYNGRNGGILGLSDDELIGGFGVRRASQNAIRDLYAVAKQVPSAIHLDGAFFVTDAALLPGLPDWLTSSLRKPPRVVLSAEDLLQKLTQGQHDE